MGSHAYSNTHRPSSVLASACYPKHLAFPYMSNRLSSSETLVEGIKKVGMAPADVGASSESLKRRFELPASTCHDSSLKACMLEL